MLTTSIEEIKQIAGEFGIPLTDEEAVLYEKAVSRNLASLEMLDQWADQAGQKSKIEREPGYRPCLTEDPYNVFITKCLVKGADKGPLLGKTVGLKDNIMLAGVPMTMGSHFMDGYVPDTDATIVTRLLNAGADIVGKLNLNGFAFRGPGTGCPGDYGRPKNPCNPYYMTGSSSSGAGAAVGIGAVNIAIGTDQGGSVRIPASWCGVVGIKPTYGLVPYTGFCGLEPSIDCVGPMAKTVREIAEVLDVIAGPDEYDPRQGGITKEDTYRDLLDQGANGLRIGIMKEGFGWDISEKDVDEAVLKTIKLLEQMGAKTTEVSIPEHKKAGLLISAITAAGYRFNYQWNGAAAFGKGWYPPDLMEAFGEFKNQRGANIPTAIKVTYMVGRKMESYHYRHYAKAQNLRHQFTAAFNEAFKYVDILAFPSTPMKSKIYIEPKDAQENMERDILGPSTVGNTAANASTFNITGHPAITVPCGKTNGLPIGITLVGPYFSERVLLQAAAAVEKLGL